MYHCLELSNPKLRKPLFYLIRMTSLHLPILHLPTSRKTPTTLIFSLPPLVYSKNSDLNKVIRPP